MEFQLEDLDRDDRAAVKFLASPYGWGGVLGGVGFAAGFFGPMVLSPGANQGPLLGIVFTGPLGLFLGLVLGVLLFLTKVPVIARLGGLVVAAIGVAIGALWLSLPEPRFQGWVLDAEVSGCDTLEGRREPALVVWDGYVMEHSALRGATSGWRRVAAETLGSAEGRILRLRLHGAWEVRQLRCPWNRGELIAVPVDQEVASERWTELYIDEPAGSCGGFTVGERRWIEPEWDATDEWPPTSSPARLLDLYVPVEVPERFLPVLPR